MDRALFIMSQLRNAQQSVCVCTGVRVHPKGGGKTDSGVEHQEGIRDLCPVEKQLGVAWGCQVVRVKVMQSSH